jgi:hypothetical protein
MNTASELLRESAGGDSAAQTSVPAQESVTTPSSTGGVQAQEKPRWTDAGEDAELREFARIKGWKAPEEMVQGYRSLEKLIGGEKVPIPKGETDTEGSERVYKALGRPATPEDCELADADRAAQYFQLGLSTRQVQARSGGGNRCGQTVHPLARSSVYWRVTAYSHEVTQWGGRGRPWTQK